MELVNEMLCVCTVGSGTDTREHPGQAEFVRLRLYLLPFPSPSSQMIHQIYLSLCWPSSCAINHTLTPFPCRGTLPEGIQSTSSVYR